MAGALSFLQVFSGTCRCLALLLSEKRGQKVFVTSVLLSSAVLLTGNNFDKVELMVKMLRLAKLFMLYQLLKSSGEKMKEQIWQTFQDKDLVLCGDARMDSPGFSAKYCAYILMDHYLDVITDFQEVVDKCEARGTSTVMEKMTLKRLMERIIEKLSGYRCIKYNNEIVERNEGLVKNLF